MIWKRPHSFSQPLPREVVPYNNQANGAGPFPNLANVSLKVSKRLVNMASLYIGIVVEGAPFPCLQKKLSRVGLSWPFCIHILPASTPPYVY